MTPQVAAEFRAGIEQGRLPQGGWPEIDRVELSVEEQRLAEQLPPGLGAGERSSLAVASTRRGLFVSDDRRARLQARDLGVRVTGTLGVLLLLVENGCLELQKANRLLGEMIASGFHSPVEKIGVSAAGSRRQ